MSEIPRYGQRSTQPREEMCPRHPGRPAVGYCKRCNRPACTDCAIPTEVGSICIDCAGPTATRGSVYGGASRSFATLKHSGAPVTFALLAINVVLFILQTFIPAVFQALAFSPIAGYFQPWRLITTGFLHGGFFHILFNMMMLVMLGRVLEQAFGWWRFLSVYFLSILGGSMAVIAWVAIQPWTAQQVTIGASGAIYGLLGAILVAQKRAGMSTASIMALIGANLLYGFIMPGVSWQAHVGGLLIGILLSVLYSWVANETIRKTRQQRLVWNIAATVAVAAVMGLGTWGLYAGLISRFIGG